MKAPAKPATVHLSDALRAAIRDSGLSYHEIARRTGLDQGQLSRYAAGVRDLTVAAASRLCLVFGLELVQTGEVLESLPADVEPTTRRRRQAGLGLPPGAEGRGQGRRVDLRGVGGSGDRRCGRDRSCVGGRIHDRAL